MKSPSADRWLGLFALIFALLLLFIWIPLDTESGLFEKVRRRLVIGDALAPTVAACVLLLGALFTWIKPGDSAGLSLSNLVWIIKLLLVFGIALFIMRYLGPLLVESTGSTEYRHLRNTFPWKLIGFVTGGTVMIAALGMLSTASFSLRFVLVGLLAALGIALAYDLPFEDLLLPPNGDV